jgi:class 3 adenylate cyclase
LRNSGSAADHGLQIQRTQDFDIAVALQASRIISNMDDAMDLFPPLMQVLRIQAGAETAHLLVLEGGKLRLKASAAAGDATVKTLASRSSDGQEHFSPAIVNYVMHTGDDVLLAEAETDPRFARCPYIESRGPQSILCCGIRHQGQLLGAVYFEHTKVVGAFNDQKLEWLRILTAEIGLKVWGGKLSRYRDYVHKFAPTKVSKEIDANPGSPDLALRDRDISVLFADLAGYTRMAELMERQALNDLINRAFSRFVDEVHRYDGLLLEITGDELLILFEDENSSRHVWKAARTALAIAKAADSLNAESCGSNPPLIVNMGINSGIASVGLRSIDASSGSAWRYGASGSVVNIAARVREVARDGGILMSGDSAMRVSNEFVLADMGEYVLKNLMKPVHIYRLLGEPSSYLGS